MSQDKRVQKLLADFETEIKAAETRRDAALEVAKNLENRNRLAIAAVNKEVLAEKKRLIAEAKAEVEELNQQITKLESVKTDLQDEISQLNDSKHDLLEEITVHESKLDTVKSDIAAAGETLSTLNIEIASIQLEIKDNSGKIQDLRSEIGQLDNDMQLMYEDKKVLNLELERVEGDIIEADANFKARKAELDRQIKDLEKRRDTVIADLTEAQNKDQAIRQNWADEQAKMDKRMEVVRRAEARLGDAEARIAELNNYMKL